MDRVAQLLANIKYNVVYGRYIVIYPPRLCTCRLDIDFGRLSESVLLVQDIGRWTWMREAIETGAGTARCVLLAFRREAS